ncbi:hypothetical protein DRO48_01425 [Candidatus Bathyarchaeota archaeon]|nr:MAG: hypothetical protein DRO48_01425 [Candidatus Bathyarchaeota archaeon]
MSVKTKSLALIASMGALGNALFILSQSMMRWGSQVALDLSHMGTLVAAVYGGPILGLLTGLVVGVGPGIYYGFMDSLGLLGLFGLPIGKAITGFSVGLIAKRLGVSGEGSSLKAVLATLVGYVPECLYTIFFFKVLVAVFLPAIAGFLIAFLVPILIKAWIEMVLMSVYIGALVGNAGFTRFVQRHFMG